MTAQVNLSLECSATEVACKGLETSVFSAVCNQVGGLTEGFATDPAHVWLFTWKYIKTKYIKYGFSECFVYMKVSGFPVIIDCENKVLIM